MTVWVRIVGACAVDACACLSVRFCVCLCVRYVLVRVDGVRPLEFTNFAMPVLIRVHGGHDLACERARAV